MQDLVSRGEMQGMKIDNCMFVRRSDVESYEPETAGRPPKVISKKKSQVVGKGLALFELTPSPNRQFSKTKTNILLR